MNDLSKRLCKMDFTLRKHNAHDVRAMPSTAHAAQDRHSCLIANSAYDLGGSRVVAPTMQ